MLKALRFTLLTGAALSLALSPSRLADASNLTGLTSLIGDGTTSTYGAATLTLATVNTNTGSFGSSTAIPTFTVNGKGLITAASTAVVVAPAGTLSGTTLASNVVGSSLTTVGTLAGLTVTGSFTATGLVTLADLANETANTVIGNGTGSPAAPQALAMPSCSGASNALTWTTSTGFGCNTISGSGTPGGSNTDVQYNNSSAFGGNSGFTYDGTSVVSLGVAGTSVGGVKLANATSGSIEIEPTTGALGTVVATLPANSGTVAETNLAQTFSAILTYTSGQVDQIRVVTASGAVTVATSDYIVVVDKTSGAATTANLPGSPTTGTVFVIKDGKGDAATNNITITPAAGDIDGATTFVINVPYESVNLVYNGVQWNVF